MELEQPESRTAGREMSPAMSTLVVTIQKGAALLTRRWLFFMNGFWALLLGGALLAPSLMALGLEGPGTLLYTIYSFTCHQLPERSFFLFGADSLFATYGKEQIVAAGADPTNLLTLRQFVGNPELGWKLGFSDRMVAMYGGAFLAGLLYGLLARVRRVRPIPIWLLVLMVVPMALDGTSHLVSEVSRLGFRETNAWAMPLLGAQSPEFYSGTTVGTLNWNLRMLTGLLFGLGTMLFAYPLMAYSFDDLASEAARTLALNEARLRARSQSG